ncbi:MAG TPA: sigma-70 family RNA polymerase sigma factor [Oligoflexia bacterium]|nr:sigma-70 family RNA polymerase sigma factor [Oligoflexia bacterium]HMP48429.1 sigma-70 family RNA polymerase sigma factor [Oligoflexia bacterium]
MSGKAVKKAPKKDNSKLLKPESKLKLVKENGSRKILSGSSLNAKRSAPSTLKKTTSKVNSKTTAGNSKKIADSGNSRKISQANYEKLILEHRENGRKLARSILRRWRVHMPGEDVDSIVDLALCEAAGRFSPKKGASFMTFFFYHLRGHLVRAVARATQASSILNGPRECDDEELSQDIISSYGSFIDNELSAQRDQENPEQIILRREKISGCREALEQLDSLEKVVLEKSYGDDETLVDIAKGLGYSRCHISRVKKYAMITLKSILQNSALHSEENDQDFKRRVVKKFARVDKGRSDKVARRKIMAGEKILSKANAIGSKVRQSKAA